MPTTAVPAAILPRNCASAVGAGAVRSCRKRQPQARVRKKSGKLLPPAAGNSGRRSPTPVFLWHFGPPCPCVVAPCPGEPGVGRPRPRRLRRRQATCFQRGDAAALESPVTDPRPTIAQIIPRLDAGGAEVTTLEVTEAIVKAGGRALIITEGGRLAAPIAAAGGEIVAFPAASKNPARILGNGYRLRALAQRESVRLIHARSRAPAWSALIAARSLRLPLVTTYHGAYQERGGLKKLYNGVMARADVVIANSRYTARAIMSRYGTPEGGIATIFRGVDLDRFAPDKVAPERVDRLRQQWGIEAGQRVVLHAARLTPLKGQAVVIAAARRLAEQRLCE